MRYFLICIFLCGMHFPGYSGNSDKADSLYNVGEYFKSAIAYERSFFYATNYKEKNEFRYKKSLCYKNLGEYSEALDELINLNLFGLKPETQSKYLYQTALIAYLAEDFTRCQTTILQLEKYKLNTVESQNLYLLGALNQIMLADFEKSKSYARNYLQASTNNENNTIIDSVLNIWYGKKNLPKLKKEKIFEWINIAPGFGQIYTGRIGEGLSNIALNLAAFGFGVYQVLNGFYFTGYFVGTLAINKFYFGGRKRATNLFKHTNQERLIAFNHNIKAHLTKGDSPEEE